MRRSLAASAALAAVALLAAGCFSSAPGMRGDFEVVESALFVADDGAFCVTDVEYDEVDDEVWLLDYMGGVQRYTPDGAYLGAIAPEQTLWRALHPEGMARVGGGEGLLVVSDTGEAYRLSVADAALEPAAAAMDGLRLGRAMVRDVTRDVVLATPADEADAAAGSTPGATVLRLDAGSGASLGALTVETGGVRALAYAPDLDALLVLSTDGTLLMVDPETGATIATGEGPRPTDSIAYDTTRGRLWSVNWALSYRVRSYDFVWAE